MGWAVTQIYLQARIFKFWWISYLARKLFTQKAKPINPAGISYSRSKLRFCMPSCDFLCTGIYHGMQKFTLIKLDSLAKFHEIEITFAGT